MKRRRFPYWPGLLVLFSVLAGSAPPVLPQGLETREGVAAAIFTLEVNLEVEAKRLERHLEGFEIGERRRREFRRDIAALYDRIAALIKEEESVLEDESLEFLEEEVRVLEEAELALRRDLRHLRDGIRDSRERMELLEEKIDSLRGALPEERESLSGTWDITYLPSGDRALFELRQGGVLVSGEYTQEGGWEGSLQGTLVKNKLNLSRIDSKQGAASDLVGFVAPDLRTIRGTWQSRVLSDGAPSQGTWTGIKRIKQKRTRESGS